MITWEDISRTDENLGRRVLVRARVIAPHLDTLDHEGTQNAIAILLGVVAEIPPKGSRRVRSRGRNGTSISYSDIGPAFSPDDVIALRSLAGDPGASGPVGSFPPARPFSQVWPEGKYS